MMSWKRPKEPPALDPLHSRCSSRYIPAMRKLDALTAGIELGSMYEIDRLKLPPRTPKLLLDSIRVVVVTAKSEQNVTVRYPSANSLETYFGSKKFVDSGYRLPPEMDEKFMMGPQLAARVLARRVPSQEVTRNQNSEAFWLVKWSGTAKAPPLPISDCSYPEDAKSKMGSCFSELLCGGMKWGTRRIVEYVRKGEEKDDGNGSHSSNHSIRVEVAKPDLLVKVSEENITGEGGEGSFDLLKNEQTDGHQVSSDPEYVIAEERTKGEEDEIDVSFARSKKRKRTYAHSQACRMLKPGRRKEAGKRHSASSKLEYRWSSDRYEKAKCELLDVMKSGNAVFGKPISRHQLRAEARKRIGDTGLLDHLLKHVVGTVAPDGASRFRRKWDPDGVMEYWLESADLVDVREAAGIKDPYWTPPPGWKLGEPTCTYDPICASEIRVLKEQLAQAKRKLQCQSDSEDDGLGAGDLDGYRQDSTGLKERYEELLRRKTEREMELVKMTKVLKQIEALMKL